MKIQVEFLAQARAVAGCDRIEVKLEPASSAADAIREAIASCSNVTALRKLLLDSRGELHSWLMVTIDNQAVLEPEQTTLTSDTVLSVMPPISGG